jgi:septal ring factor EnvC (AmiA/AmiB activator)
LKKDFCTDKHLRGTSSHLNATVIPDVERGMDAYRKKLDDAYAAKLKQVQESVDEIQRTAGQKTAMLKELQSENGAVKQEIIKLQGVNTFLKEKISNLERELSNAEHFMEEKEVR